MTFWLMKLWFAIVYTISCLCTIQFSHSLQATASDGARLSERMRIYFRYIEMIDLGENNSLCYVQ